MISQILRRLYIKITDGQIVEYKGVQDEKITIDGIAIEPAAKSEDYRIQYIPTAELDVDSRKKFIKIPIVDPTVKIAGAVIEQSTFKRQMVYTTNDIAYLQDIEALNKKIEALAEQSHDNDIDMYNTYATVDEVNTVLADNYVLKSDLPIIPDTSNLTNYRMTNDLNYSTIKNISFERLSSTVYETGPFVNNSYIKGFFLTVDGEEIRLDFIFQLNSLSGENAWYCSPFSSTVLPYNILQVRWIHDVKTDVYKIIVHYVTDRPFTLESITYEGTDELALKSNIPEPIDVSNFATKSEIPTDYVVKNDALINSSLTVSTSYSSLTNLSVANNDLTNRQTIGIALGKGSGNAGLLHLYYQEPGIGGLCLSYNPNIITFTKSDINLNKPTTINSSQAINEAGLIHINTTGTNNWIKGLSILAQNLANNHRIINAIDKDISKESFAYFGYHHPGTCIIGLNMNDDIITITEESINLNKNTTITGNLTVSGTITEKTNTTITHYSPIEESIDKYQLGKPVFMSGNVYKQQGNEWITSCEADTTICICSVKSTGTWKEFVGIITEIDAENNCITFATHGDFLFNVDNSSKYQIGDVVLYDGTILGEDDALTIKIQQLILYSKIKLFLEFF